MSKSYRSDPRNHIGRTLDSRFKGFPRMDFREWIFKVGIDKAENEPRQVAENCYSLR